MNIIENKLQNIYHQLLSLLPLFKNICVKKINSLPNQINKIIIGENKVSSYVGKTIKNLTEDDLAGATTINSHSFYDCTNLNEVTIPDSVTSIKSSAFKNCTNLKSITIPDSVTSVDSYAFEDCTGLTSITIPDSVTSISYCVLDGCTSLESITIPFIGTSIRDNIYLGFLFGATSYRNHDRKVPASLKEVIISNQCLEIGLGFSGCQNLKSITIGSSVTRMVGNAFTSCGVTNLYMLPTTPPVFGENKPTLPTYTTIHVPIGSGEAYKSATNWSLFADRIVEDIEL